MGLFFISFAFDYDRDNDSTDDDGGGCTFAEEKYREQNCNDGIYIAEYRNGLAEVVKYGMIMDGAFFELLADNIDKLNRFEPDFYEKIIIRSCECKAQVVAGDEFEHGNRAILNYGHTVGHAVEKLSDFALPHGRAVAIGMAAAARLAVLMGLCSCEVENTQNKLLAALKLPVRLPENSSVNEIIQAMYCDKKNSSGSLTMILPTAVGAVKIVRNIDENLLKTALEAIL